MIFDNCDVYLEGSIHKMPFILTVHYSEVEIVISRRTQRSDEIELYKVILNWDDAIQIMNYGYVGMSVMVSGFLRVRRNVEVVANKISFISFSNEGSNQIKFNKNPSYGLPEVFLDKTLHTVH